MSSKALDFKQSRHADLTVLSLAGHLNSLTVPEIRPEIETIATSRTYKVALEISELEVIDSSGIAAIVSLFKRIRRHGGDMKIVGLRGQPEKIMDLMGLNQAFDIVPTLQDAVRGFSKTGLTREGSG